MTMSFKWFEMYLIMEISGKHYFCVNVIQQYKYITTCGFKIDISKNLSNMSFYFDIVGLIFKMPV